MVELSSLDLHIWFLEGSGHPEYLKTTGFNGAVGSTVGEARQVKGARRVAKKKPSPLRPKKAPSVVLLAHFDYSLLPSSSLLSFAPLSTHFSSFPPSALLSVFVYLHISLETEILSFCVKFFEKQFPLRKQSLEITEPNNCNCKSFHALVLLGFKIQGNTERETENPDTTDM